MNIDNEYSVDMSSDDEAEDFVICRQRVEFCDRVILRNEKVYPKKD